MKKYFILFLSVLLLVVCGCNTKPKNSNPSYTIFPQEDGLKVVVSAPEKYKHAELQIWDLDHGRYNLSVDFDPSEPFVYSFVAAENRYETYIYIYEDNNGDWTNGKYVGWCDVTAKGGSGNFSITGNGVDYDGSRTVSITNYNFVKPTYINGNGFVNFYTTSADEVWTKGKYTYISDSEQNNNMSLDFNSGSFVILDGSKILDKLTGDEPNFWCGFHYEVFYNGFWYYQNFNPEVLNTYSVPLVTYVTSNNLVKIANSTDGFKIIKGQNYNYPNVRISVYNETQKYECPRISTDAPYRKITYDYLNPGDEYTVKLELWNENWTNYYSTTVKGIFARGGNGDISFKYDSVEYYQGTEETEYVANLVLKDAEFIGSRMPENYTMNGNLWYSSNNKDFYNKYLGKFEKSYDSTEKIFTIDVSPLLPTIRGLYFYPELVSEWEYNGTKYQLTIIDDDEAVMKDTHVKPESYELDKEFNFVPEYGNFEVADELQGKKAYLIKYNKNSSKVNDSCIIKNASTLEESLSKARCAAEDAIANGVVPDTIRRWEVDFVGYDFGEPIGPKNVSRNAVPLANYDDYAVDVTSDNFLIQNETDSKFYEHKATLKAIGNHCNVWYVNNNDKADKVLQAAIADKKTGFQTVADKFDTFFEYETYLAGSNVPTKDYLDIIDIDDSVKIDILICDIDEQYKDGMNGGVYGYFWSKDMTLQTQIASSNERQMIYIDSAFLGKDPVYMYATLSHEFQHLLLYVNKRLNKKLDFPTWYTEMMSLGMEDVLQIACLEYKNNEAISGRVYSFNGGYNAGFVDWGKMNGSVYYSYANAAIFMDYLLKNYGGVDLYYEIAHNNYVGQESITKALQKLGYNETFDTVMMKMGQVIVNSFAATLPADAITVNKKASSTLNINGKNVVFKFNELDLKNYSHDNSTKNYNTADRYLNYSFDYKGNDGKTYTYYYGGPSVLLPNKNFTKIYSNAITVNLISETPSKIQLYNPGNNIEMAVYLCDVYNK